MARTTRRKCGNPGCDMYSKPLKVNGTTTECRNCGKPLVDVPMIDMKYFYVLLVLVVSSVVWWFCLDRVNTQFKDNASFLKRQSQEQSQPLKELEKDNSNLKKQDQERNRLLKELEKDNSNLKKQDQERNRLLKELEKDNSNLKKQDQERNRLLKELEKDNSNLKKQDQERNRLLKELEKDNSNLKKQDQERNRLLKELEKDNSNLKRQNQELRIEKNYKQPIKECYIETKDFSYQGECQDRLPHGWGIKTWGRNGYDRQDYEGQFEKGVMQGCGTLTTSDGIKMENQLWQNGKVTGKTCGKP